MSIDFNKIITYYCTKKEPIGSFQIADKTAMGYLITVNNILYFVTAFTE